MILIVLKELFNEEEFGNKTNSELGSTFTNALFKETELNFIMRGYNLNNIIKIIGLFFTFIILSELS